MPKKSQEKARESFRAFIDVYRRIPDEFVQKVAGGMEVDCYGARPVAVAQIPPGNPAVRQDPLIG